MTSYISMSGYYSFGFLLFMLVCLSSWDNRNSYGMALAIPEMDLKQEIESTGLTPEEETLFRDMIEAMASNTKQPWYSKDFSREDVSSYKDALDLLEVIKLWNLADSSMKVVQNIDTRFKKIVEEEKKRLGRRAAQKDTQETLYRLSTNSRDLVLEIKKHDCLKNKYAIVPTNDTTDIAESVWQEYSDSVSIPFICPIEYDFNRTAALKRLQEYQARIRVKRTVEENTEVDHTAALLQPLQHQERSRLKRATGENSGVNIIQVNLTITSEIFNKSLLNIRSSNYLRLTNNLTSAIEETFSSVAGYKCVNDFSFRSGSVIATFHIEMNGIGSTSMVQEVLQNATINGTFGVFVVNASLLEVGLVFNENGVYSSWQEWSACSKSCGTGEKTRRRSCNSTTPLACAHLGPSIETTSCYEKYCSSDCSQELTGDYGNFSSPNVNGKYPANAKCEWQINVDENHTIVVEFREFELEEDKKCKFDYVAFYDGDFSKPLMSFCGNNTPPRSHPSYGYPVNSTSSSLKVVFRSDDTKERKGFTAKWYKSLKLHLRVSNVVPQAVTTLSLIHNPWSVVKDAAIPLGKATTCPRSLGDNDCYFPGKQNVISRVISVYLSRNLPIEAKDPILVTFEHILDEDMFPYAYTGRKTCVTWDHSITSPRYGAWTRRGCSISFSNLTHTFCKCLHTGIFAVLGEIEGPPKELYLKANTYFGIAVALLFVIATAQSLTSKEGRTTGELFHLFETLVSGLLLVIYLVGAHVTAEKELCGFLAFFIYYLVLSQFTWMLLTVFWIQNLMKRFLSEKVKTKVVYFVLGWGVPLILAGVAGKVNIDQHGNKDNVCWVSISGAGTVWGYGAPVFAMFLVNVAIFAFLLSPLGKQNYDYEKMRIRIVKEMMIMFFFLMSWVFALRVVLNDCFTNQYFFCIFLILQGAVNYNACIETTEQFWKTEETEQENEPEKEESKEKSVDETEEKDKDEEQTNQPPRMTVKTLKNLNIYKENGVFVIEA